MHRLVDGLVDHLCRLAAITRAIWAAHEFNAGSGANHMPGR